MKPSTGPDAASLAALVDRMTLEERVSLLAGADFWRTVAVPRLGVPQLKVTDGPAGARGGGALVGGKRTAAFPVGIALGSSWNAELVREVGEALAGEVLDKGAGVVLAPTINLFRNALNGRNFENYSEDPFLTGRLAVAYVRGVQSKGVGATPKHFVGNESEFERDTISSEIPARALRELYLRPFEMVVAEARPWAIMTGYNRLGGTFCSEHPGLLLGILRGEWGFDGLVMSDWGGTHSAGASARAGLDLEMPGPARARAELLAEAERDPATRAAVRERALEVLRLVARTTDFANPRDVRDEMEKEVDDPGTRALIRRAGAEGTVLLKNDGLLPIPAGAKVAVIGPNAAVGRVMGGGSAQINAHRQVSPLEGLREALGADRVAHAVGCDNDRYLPLARGAMKIEFRAADGEKVLAVEERPSGEAQWVKLPPGVPADFRARLSLEVSAPEAAEYEFALVSTGLSRLYLGDELLIENWDSWQPGGTLVGMGSVELRRTRRLAAGAHRLVAEYGPREYTEGVARLEAIRIGFARPLSQESVVEAVAVAAAADVAVVCVGTHGEWETEGEDRTGLDLPGRQDELVQAVARANPRTVVVLQTGGPVRMPWLDAVPAALQAWFPGQEAGHAIADVLLGVVDPGGRLSQTFPRGPEDDPTSPLVPDVQYPGAGGRVEYREGLFTGYRHVDRSGVRPLFPFGFGLSYTTFELSNLKADPPGLRPGETLRVAVSVANTGARAGSTVVQVYVRDLVSSLERPDKELKAFAKVHLDAGKTATVELSLDMRSLAYFDDAREAWVAEAGEFDLLVGQSSADLPLRLRFALAAPWTQAAGPSSP